MKGEKRRIIQTLVIHMLVVVTIGQVSLPFKSHNIEYEHFFNHGNVKKIKDVANPKLENEVLKSKVEVLGEVLKRRVQALRNIPGQTIELIFLVDSSASVGPENFFNELKFVKKLLADFTVAADAARVAVVTFSSKNRVVRHIDHLTYSSPDKHKCRLLEQELPSIGYTGGGTYTLGAVLEAQAVLDYSRPEAAKAVFLVTDGYSNGGDPRPAAKKLREQGVEIFTFGIRNGNVKELFDMASEPQQEHSFIVDSFEEFEALARRALHEDLHTGSFLLQNRTSCERLCLAGGDCCHINALCTCGTHTGHYACVCPPGNYGTGLKDDCHPCPGGTYRSEGGPGDLRSCTPCPDENHISEPGSTSVEQCVCQRGYIAEGNTCRLLACPKLEPPKNGYFVKNVCNSVFNGACGIRCNAGYKLVGSSIRLCQENGTWSGDEAQCVMRSCGEIKAPKNGRMNCTQNDYVIDTECEFSCETGYSLVGSRKRVCLPIGYWDGLPAFCKPVYCSPLPKLMNGTLSPSKCSQAKSRYGEECTAVCQPGFELRGPSSRKCMDNSIWSDEESKTRCLDITPPSIICPDNITVTAEPNEHFAMVSWDPPQTSDNSGYTPDVISLPAVTEQPMKFRIGTSSITYVAHDRRGNKAECVFHITVLDIEPPTVDQCESPPTFLLRDRQVSVQWDEPVFSDNSGKLSSVTRSHNPGIFPLGETEVTYRAWDESGNNSTCKITINVQEHACHLPIDPIHGQANCTQKPDAVYCSLTCHDGYAFALPPPQDYFCAYDGQWLPSGNPIPFPDCSITTHSNAISQDGIIRLGAESKICDDPFLMNHMEGQFKRRLAARLNEICGDNMICEVDDMEAQCRQIVAEEDDDDWAKSNEIPRSKRDVNRTQQVTEEPTELVTITVTRPRKEKKRTLELRFKVLGRYTDDVKEKTVNSSEKSSQQVLLISGMEQLKNSLTEAALTGEFDVHYGGKELNVFAVQFNDDQLRFTCSAGSVPQGEQCVYCPVGTYFNVVSETCESCSQGSYQPNEGQLSCLVCPQNTSTKIVNAKSPEECQAQCLPGSFSASGLEPCMTCPHGTYQPEYFQRDCIPCGRDSTTWRRGARRAEDCKPVCPKGYVSETGLDPCFPCPIGFYQSQSGQKFCIKCPKGMTTAGAAAVTKAECQAETYEIGWNTDTVEEFEQAVMLEVNECFSLPCQHGGLCNLLEFGYVCSCQPGFTGMQCETNIDDCVSSPCMNSGTCIDGVNNFTCQCPSGFTGHQCETNIDECLSNPCRNAGTCVDRVLGYICVCSAGFTGPHCDIEINECISDPCQNNGTCIDHLANYTCLCPSGWTGQICDEAVDECISEPCHNGGTCEDQIGSFLCTCLKGYDGPQCENDINECLPSPCALGSTCVDQIGSFLCLCPPGVSGTTCDNVIDGNFTLHFTSSGKLDYVLWEGLRRNTLTELTLCSWLNTDDHINYGTPFSYATDAEANVLTLTDYSGFVLYVNGQKVVTDVTANDGHWHLICVTWTSRDGQWKIYSNGELKDQGVGLATNSTISPNGTVILGQEQDTKGGAFSAAESYLGFLYGIELWNRAFDDEAIRDLMVSCTNNKGNVLTWSDFKHGLRGGIRVEESPFCKSCPEPKTPAFGNVTSSSANNQMVAFYTCQMGYELTAASPWRSCVVYGGWSGLEPECKKISCGFPGYILNGLVHGNSFYYGDTVTYNCTRGYRLVGNGIRTCEGNGSWSGEPPQCQSITCDTPQEPINGSLTNLQEFYAAGEQALFQCKPKFRLDGTSVLTCLDDGQWDDVPPLCQPLACTQPPFVDHGIITNGVTEIDSEELLNYLSPGSILTYSCLVGYQLNSQASILCGHDGLWIGDMPRCVPINCGPPAEIIHATVQSNKGNYLVGAKVSYLCDEGYDLFGPTELECTERGTWLDRNKQASLPACMPVDCGPLPSLENGEIYVEDQIFNSIASLKCYPGYKLIGPSQRQCLANKTWSGIDSRCDRIVCTDPPPVRNGILMTHSFTANDYAQYRCEEGYQLSKMETLLCAENGAWQGEAPICLPLECPTPGIIESGSWIFPDNLIENQTAFFTGAEITYVCDEGYKLIGESQRRCDGSLGWLPRVPLPICEKMSCPSLENIEHGTVIVDGFEEGQIATYECDPGYQVEGSALRVCTTAGSWSEEPPHCHEILCSEPDAVENGTVTFTSVTYGSKALYQCNEGFVLSGSNQKICGDEGTWIGGKIPVCSPRQCRVPEIIEHGYIGYEGSLYIGSSIIYECAEGYEIIGIRERFCLPSGDWTDEEPYCQLIYCHELPQHLDYGTVTGNDTVYGSVISFQCNPGYELLGQSDITCESNKKWSAPYPICKPVKCPHPGIIANGFMALKQLDNKLNPDLYHYGDVISFSCRQGYNISGSAELKCLADRIWSGKIPTCTKIYCQPPQIPENGYTTRSVPNDVQGQPAEETDEKTIGNAFGKSVRFGCKTGFQLVGSPIAKCLENGKWDSDPPTCVPVKCPTPPKINHAAHNGTKKEYLAFDVIQYICDEGFRLKGDGVLRCEGTGSWNQHHYSCQRSVCPFKDYLENGHVIPIYATEGQKSTTAVVSLKFSCKSGYDLVGHSLLHCTSSGEWNEPFPVCVAWPCPSPSIPKHGHLQSTQIKNGVIIATMKCDPGYFLKDNGTITCGSKGVWSNSIECHRKTCPTPKAYPHTIQLNSSSIYKYGDRIIFSCRDGYTLDDPLSSLICNEDGNWVGQEPVCSATKCPKLNNPQNGRLELVGNSIAFMDSLTVGSRIQMICNDGYVLQGSPDVICQNNGQWSQTIPLCKALSCPEPPPVDNMMITYRGNRVGDVISYTCQPGFHLKGDKQRTCLVNGQWSGTDPACDPIVCPVPETPTNGWWHIGGFTPGATIRFECQPGYTLVGSAILTCLDNKEWSDQVPTCQQVYCYPLKDPVNGFVRYVVWMDQQNNMDRLTLSDGQSVTTFKELSYRSEAHYSCESGYQLFGQEKRLCTANGTWSEQSPHCQRIWCREPQPPEQGFVMGIGRQFGDKVRFACSIGYRLIGSDEATCQASGSWSSSPPQCQALTCDLPPHVVHTLVPETNHWPVGTHLVLQCQPGYWPVGDLGTQCLPNQQWSSISGKCLKTNCQRPVIKGAATILGVGGTVPTNGNFNYGDRVVVSCQPGRRNRGSAILTCQSNGQWSGPIPQCESQCELRCSNGGICLSNRKCSCPPGYSGDRCQHAHCILPCLHGGTCVAPYRCACQSGWSGTRCEKPVCEPSCSHGGHCIAPNTCHCPSGSSGNACRGRSSGIMRPRG